jgi:hypothetical protein
MVVDLPHPAAEIASATAAPANKAKPLSNFLAIDGLASF